MMSKVGVGKKTVLDLEVSYGGKTELAVQANLRKEVRFVEKAGVALKIALVVKVFQG